MTSNRGHNWKLRLLVFARIALAVFLGCGIAWAGRAADVAASAQPARLRCESQENPLGVESLHPRFSWILEAPDVSFRGVRQTAYQILVGSEHALANNKAEVWDSGKVMSAESIHVRYRGPQLTASHRYFWKVRTWDQKGVASNWSGASRWTMGLLAPADWKAKWIAAEADRELPPRSTGENSPISVPKPLPIFRAGFQVEKQVAQALVYVSGLGQYELRLNGKKVGDDVLTPGWTNYRKTVFYNTYDVTALLRTGENAVGVLLGNGMYNVERYAGRYTKFVGSFGQPKLIVQLNIKYTDGSEAMVSSDHSWKWTPGPITFSSTYGGEDFDARREPPGWDASGFDDSSWSAPVEVEGPGGRMSSQRSPAIRVMQVYPAGRPVEPSPGILVYDLGQNFSGWPQIRVSGPAGSTIKLVPGELLDASGLVTQRSSGGPTYFSYTLGGGAEEQWRPRFSYYGFRYLQVEGASAQGDANSAKPVLRAVEGQFVRSSAGVTGDFSSSNRLINRIHGLIEAAMRSNMQSVLTDCPHREKLGWLEESHLLGAALMYDFDLSRLYGKIAGDMSDAQLANGLIPDTAPEYVVFDKGFRDSPEWGSAAVLDPWLAYQFYGDREIMAEHYAVMRRYVDYLTGRAEGHIISYGLGDWYDIGPGGPGESKLTNRGVTATAIHYLDLTVLRRVASVLGRSEDARRYGQLADAVRAAFNSKLFHEKENQYDTGSQTANAMPLAVGLVPDTRRAAVLQNLVLDIRKHNNHVTAGDVGFHFVVQALTEGGRSDVLYDTLSRTDSPSYGYQLAQGATTLTEAWDSNPHSSQNHFMLGHAEEWFYRGLAGIHFDLSRSPSEQIVIRPAMVSDIASASASYDSIYGTIEVHWSQEQGTASVSVTIPPNTSATVYLPSGRSIRESGKQLGQATGVKQVRYEGKNRVLQVGSGHYQFEWDY